MRFGEQTTATTGTVNSSAASRRYRSGDGPSEGPPEWWLRLALLRRQVWDSPAPYSIGTGIRAARQDDPKSKESKVEREGVHPIPQKPPT